MILKIFESSIIGFLLMFPQIVFYRSRLISIKTCIKFLPVNAVVLQVNKTKPGDMKLIYCILRFGIEAVNGRINPDSVRERFVFTVYCKRKLRGRDECAYCCKVYLFVFLIAFALNCPIFTVKSFANKVCSCRECNAAKKNRTGFDFMKNKSEDEHKAIN